MKFLPYAFASLCLLGACTSNEIGNSKDVNPQAIFIDYSVFGDENDDSVTCLAQFRFAGENGTTLILNEPSQVRIDDSNVAVDSNEVMGAFYEKRFATGLFAGTHSWKYVDRDSNHYSTAFVFTPFRLKKQLPAVQSRRDSLLIELNGLQNETEIIAELADTSSKTDDIILKYKTVNGRLVIPVSTWQRLDPGPVYIQISATVTTTLPISERPAEGGRLSVNYSLERREFRLKNDSPDFASEN